MHQAAAASRSQVLRTVPRRGRELSLDPVSYLSVLVAIPVCHSIYLHRFTGCFHPLLEETEADFWETCQESPFSYPTDALCLVHGSLHPSLPLTP